MKSYKQNNGALAMAFSSNRKNIFLKTSDVCFMETVFNVEIKKFI